MKGKKIATLPGTNSDYFLSLFLEKNGLKTQDVQIISMKPPEMIIAISRGDIDALFAWEPHIYFAKKGLKDNYVVFESNELYNGTHSIMMQRSFVEKNPETVKKIIRGLIKAEDFAKNNPDKAKQITTKHTGISIEALDEIYDEYKFEVRINNQLLELLEKQADWALESTNGKKPDFKSHVYTKALKEIDTAKVTLK